QQGRRDAAADAAGEEGDQQMDACWSAPPSASGGLKRGRLGCTMGHRQTLAALTRALRNAITSARRCRTPDRPAHPGGRSRGAAAAFRTSSVRTAWRFGEAHEEGAEVEQQAVVPAERVPRADGAAEVAQGPCRADVAHHEGPSGADRCDTPAALSVAGLVLAAQ
ncbi:MAG: hypothetical protein JWR66_3178, partial [Modestobacter sp.]|nr:hypothetical protein [Modestobacter sp.]